MRRCSSAEHCISRNDALRAGCMHFKTYSLPSLDRRRKLQSYSPGRLVATADIPYRTAANRSASRTETAIAARSSRNMSEILSASAPTVHSGPRVQQLKIPGGDFSAYLFDCDGTIAVHAVALHRMEGSAGRVELWIRSEAFS